MPIEWSTRRGKVNISSFCSPDDIASLSFIDAYTKYAGYRSIVSKKETLIKAASQPDTNVTLDRKKINQTIDLGYGKIEQLEDEIRRFLGKSVQQKGG